jgi:hypothetical protein
MHAIYPENLKFDTFVFVHNNCSTSTIKAVLKIFAVITHTLNGYHTSLAPGS